jgi:hypothetical protein
MRFRKSFWLSPLLVLSCVFLLTASITNVSTGTWQTWNPMGDVRSGAAAVLLQDGRVLIIGGNNANGPVASADLFGTDGNFSAAAVMQAPRSGHTATVLSDGRVLVAGGATSGGGITNSAEIYEPSADSWTVLSGTMVDARSGHTASLLPDGSVLLAGGQNSGGAINSLEIFDPSSGNFSGAGVMTSARMNHAAAALQDGRVLLLGGSDGTNPLASVDVFDPSAGTVSAGPNLSSPRVSASATATLDGKVVVIGGNNGASPGLADLATADILVTDPSTRQLSSSLSASHLLTPRSGHQSFLLPKNNAILVIGGSSFGTNLNSAELYYPWADTFQATGSMSVPRPGFVGSATSQDGVFLAAGGTGLSNTELYGSATVKTDAADYPPGSTVTITGSGWQPGETVTLTLVESPLIDTHGPYTTVADAFGNISDSSFVTDAYDENIRFYLTASGSQSQAQNTFTDSKPNTASLSPSSFTVLPGNTATYTVTVNFNGNNDSCTSPLSLAFTSPAPVGTTNGFSPNPLISTGGDASSTLTITTRNTGPASGRTQPGTYPFTVTAGNGAGCQAGTASANGTLAVAGSATALSVTGYPSPTTAGTPQNFTVTALDANGNTAIGYANTVHFTSSDSQAVLPANYTFVAADKGTHTFSATLKTAGTQSITATDTVTGTITGTQGGIAVSAAATAKLLVANYPSPVTAGTSNSFTVTATDASGNLTAGYTGTVHFTSSDGAATLPANYTFTTGNGKDNGTHTFSATLNTAGAQSITATDTGTASINGTQPGITVNASTVATSLALAAPSPASVAFGSAGPVTFSATLTRTTGGAAVSGATVNFTVDGNAAGSATTSASGVATVSNYNPSAISVAGHDVQASFAGAAISGTTYSASTSGIQTLTVSTADQTINFGTLADKTYGDASFTVSATGGASGNAVTFTASPASVCTATGTNGSTITITGAGACAVTAHQAGNSNYNAATDVQQSLTVNKKDATWTTNPSNKTYGEVDPTPLTTGSGSGFLVADSVSATYSRVAGETVAGSPYHVTATLSATVAGALNNYNITNAGASFTINRRDATWTTSAGSKTYGDADPTPLTTGSSNNFVAADNVTASYSRAAGETVLGGPYHITAALSPASVLSNYNITNAGANFTINRRDATWSTNTNSKTYGDADATPLTTGSGNNFVAADNVTASYSRAAGETVLGGPYHIAAALSPAGVLSNYNVTNAGANFTINRRDATWNTNVGSKTYGDADPSPLTTDSGNNFVAADNVTASYSRTAGETVLGGPYHITAALSPAGVLSNYNITNTGANFTINRRDATWSTNAGSKTYGDADPSPLTTGSGNNFVAADNVTASYTRATGETVLGGTYHISAALSPAGVLDNYNITNTGASFTINKRDASVTPNAASKTYGDSDPALTGALTNFVASDGVIAAYSRTVGETVAASPYTISAALSPVAVLSNYNLTNNTAAFTINKRDASVTPNVASKTYGDSDPGLTGALTNFVASDGVTASYSRTAGETVAGSPYSISAALSPTAVLGNYNLTYNTAAFTIGKATLTVKADNKTMVLHDALPTFTATYTGFKFSDTFASAVTGRPILTTTASPASAE